MFCGGGIGFPPFLTLAPPLCQIISSNHPCLHHADGCFEEFYSARFELVSYQLCFYLMFLGYLYS